jgi:2-polyprenyl-3-methyl-5-hydroxy-6-metoxy-1,4-benzoquinol methylase
MNVMNKSRQDHWQDVYTKKREDEVSWFRPRPASSIELIEAADVDSRSAIIDIGGGASRLVDNLLDRGYRDLSVLDISQAALSVAQQRLGSRRRDVNWIVSDDTQWQPDRKYDVWHDRAAFHFLTSPEDQDAYLRALDAGTAPGAVVIIFTYALDGPEKCSGLPVQLYSAATLSARLGPRFQLVKEGREDHRTPGGAVQKFVYAVFRKTGG